MDYLKSQIDGESRTEKFKNLSKKYDNMISMMNCCGRKFGKNDKKF